MVVQGIITHLVLSKRIAMLDQFAAGLEILDVLHAVRAKPAIFESQSFCHICKEDISW